MNDFTYCEKCSAIMEYYQRYGSCGMTCPKCGWGWATTYIAPIKRDEIEYTLTIQREKPAKMETIRSLAHLFICNYLEAKKKIETDNIKFKNRAPKTLDIAKLLVTVPSSV